MLFRRVTGNTDRAIGQRRRWTGLRRSHALSPKRLLPCTVQPLGAGNSVIEDRVLVAAAIIREDIELNGDLSERDNLCPKK